MSTDRKPGYYWVKLPWGRWIIAEWRGRPWDESTGAFWLTADPRGHEADYFTEIGPNVEDQLRSVVEAHNEPTYGDSNNYADNMFAAAERIETFLKELGT